VGVKLLLGAEVSDPSVATIEYGVPTRPAKVQLATEMTPDWGTIEVHELQVPLEGTAALNAIGAVAAVTARLEESSTVRTGSIANTEPESPATGSVVKSNWVATFVILNVELTA
jgi:hypothetical protein